MFHNRDFIRKHQFPRFPDRKAETSRVLKFHGVGWGGSGGGPNPVFPAARSIFSQGQQWLSAIRRSGNETLCSRRLQASNHEKQGRELLITPAACPLCLHTPALDSHCAAWQRGATLLCYSPVQRSHCTLLPFLQLSFQTLPLLKVLLNPTANNSLLLLCLHSYYR